MKVQDEEYDRVYGELYRRLKAEGKVPSRGGRYYLDSYSEGFLDGVEAALQEVTFNEDGDK